MHGVSDESEAALGSVLDQFHPVHPFHAIMVGPIVIDQSQGAALLRGQYLLVDLEGHKDNPKVKKALSDLQDQCKFLKVLGSYPVGK